MTIAFDRAVWTVLREPGTFFTAYFTKEEAYTEVKALHEASPHLCFKIRRSDDKYIIIYREIPKELLPEQPVTDMNPLDFVMDNY